MKKLFFVLMLAVVCFAGNNPQPYNSLVIEDSMYVDGTETKYSKVFWVDNSSYKTLVIEGKDSANYAVGGWAVCSSAVKIEVMQVFPVKANGGYYQYAAMLNSHAHPDSTTMHPVSFSLYDSLNVFNMDTSAVYLRNLALDNVFGADSTWTYGDSLKTLQTSGFGSYGYSALPADYGPGIVYKITGLNTNDSRGQGSFWRFMLHKQSGVPVRGK